MFNNKYQTNRNRLSPQNKKTLFRGFYDNLILIRVLLLRHRYNRGLQHYQPSMYLTLE